MNMPKGKTPSLISGKKPKKILIKRNIKCTRCKGVIALGASKNNCLAN